MKAVARPQGLYTVSTRRPGEVILHAVDRKLHTHDEVVALRRRLKAEGYEVFARKVVKLPQRKAPTVRDRRSQAKSPGQKWEAWRNSQREAIKRRSWRCESVEMCAEQGVHVHHAFGRIEEPWASSQLLGLNLCVGHHERAHSDTVYRDRLRLLALTRLCFYLGPLRPEVKTQAETRIRYEPPKTTYEWLITIARSAGIQPPGWKE